MKNLKLLVIALLFILTMGLLAACGSSQGESQESGNADQGAEGSEEGLSGEVQIDGSSTVTPLMEAAMYQYNQENPEVQPVMNTSGTGGGFSRFVEGETDISMASRPIKEEEAAAAEENGIEYMEIEVAYDGLSVVVSQENDFLEEITVDELRQIFLADSDAKQWSDINPDYPDEDIVIYSPGHDSGTFDYFNEVILEEEPMREGEGVTLSEDDNTLVTGIQSDPNAIGFFGYAYYVENQDTLKALAVENEEGEFVTPESESIQSNTYSPLSRPLFIYVNTASLEEKPQVYDFTEFVIENAGSAAEQVGYVALPQEEYDSQMSDLESYAGE